MVRERKCDGEEKKRKEKKEKKRKEKKRKEKKRKEKKRKEIPLASRCILPRCGEHHS